MNQTSVGKLYNPSKTSWPEVAQYNYRSGQHELVLFLASPTANEIQGFRSARSEFGLLVEGDVLFLLYRFGGAIPWSDAPYSYWLVPENERILPEAMPSPALRSILSMILVDAETGIVRGIRAVSFSPEFTTALHKAIRGQAERGTPTDYDAQLASAYRKYPSTAQMLSLAIITKGGA